MRRAMTTPRTATERASGIFRSSAIRWRRRRAMRRCIRLAIRTPRGPQAAESAVAAPAAAAATPRSLAAMASTPQAASAAAAVEVAAVAKRTPRGNEIQRATTPPVRASATSSSPSPASARCREKPSTKRAIAAARRARPSHRRPRAAARRRFVRAPHAGAVPFGDEIALDRGQVALRHLGAPLPVTKVNFHTDQRPDSPDSAPDTSEGPRGELLLCGTMARCSMPRHRWPARADRRPSQRRARGTGALPRRARRPPRSGSASRRADERGLRAGGRVDSPTRSRGWPTSRSTSASSTCPSGSSGTNGGRDPLAASRELRPFTDVVLISRERSDALRRTRSGARSRRCCRARCPRSTRCCARTSSGWPGSGARARAGCWC